jgi:hypothetical protein
MNTLVMMSGQNRNDHRLIVFRVTLKVDGQWINLTGLEVQEDPIAQIGGDGTVTLASGIHVLQLEFNTVYNVQSIRLDVTKTDAWNNNVVVNEIIAKFEHSVEHIFSINGDVSLAKGNHVWSISDWSDEFKVEYDVIVNKDLSIEWISLFHLTTGKRTGEGSRIPAVFVNKGKFFQICNHVNGVSTYGYQTNYNYELNKEYHFEISQQTNSKGEYVYSIKVNGETFHEIVNTTPLKFKDVKLYLSDPWHVTFEPFGKLSNLKVNADLTQ